MPPSKPPTSKQAPKVITPSVREAEKYRTRRKALEKLIESEMNKKTVDVRNVTRLMAFDVQLAGSQYERTGDPGAAILVARRHVEAIRMLKIGGHISERPPESDDGWDDGLIAAAEEAQRVPGQVITLLPGSAARDDDIVDEG
jgi:hypothetical protein